MSGLLADDSPAARRWSFLLFLSAVAGSCAVMLWTGPYVQNGWGHDIPVYYSTAWKMLWGYKPHIDFNCTHGIFNFLPMLAGMKLTGVNAYSIVTGNTLFFLVVSLMAWAVCRIRFAPGLCLIYTLFVGWTIMCAHYLRYDLFATSYAGLYNRQGYALLLVLMAQAFLPRRPRFARQALIDGAIFGAILVVLFFLKITYFMTGLGILALGLLLLHFSWRMIAGLLLGSAIVALPILVYFHFNLAPYFQDLALAGSVRASLSDNQTNPAISVISGRVALHYVREMTPAVLLLLLICFLGLRRSEGRWLNRIQPWFPFLYVGAVATASLCLLLTNSPIGNIADVPLVSGLGLILAEAITRVLTLETSSLVWRRALVLFIAIGVMVPFSVSSLGSVGYSAYYKWRRAKELRPEMKFDAAPLAGLILPGHGGDPPLGPFTYAQKINDGMALLDRNVSRDATVETLDFTNIFPFASGRPPAKGALSWQYGLSFSKEHTLSPERAFGNPDAFLIPKYSGDPDTTRILQEMYHDYLQANYRLTAESDQWVLLQRKK